MTTTLPTAGPSSRPGPAGRPPRRSRSRTGIVVLLIVSLVAAGALREIAADYQARSAGERGLPVSHGTLGNMNSFALALLLGGLRGPLVMFLWSTSEAQKTDRDLEDLDTKIEWIRMLQPEFDTVHLFQIWNKAYNISAMMASPANKYMIIMEAIDYGYKVDQERPGDLNILQAIGGTYGGKLGANNLPEEPFYQRQFREESLTDANRLIAFPEDAKSFQHLSNMKPLLDAQNRIRLDLITPTRARRASANSSGGWNDGSALQYLKKYEPFPWGINTHGMAFNYAKRAEVALNTEGQEPLQLSAMVVDSQPGILLKAWAEDEADRANALMARAFGITPEMMTKNGLSMAQIKLDQKPVDANSVSGALLSYDLSSRLCRDAVGEYRRHMSDAKYVGRIALYQSHLDDLFSLEQQSTADHDYLAAMLATGDERTRLLNKALETYRLAMILIEKNVLVHYVNDQLFLDWSFKSSYNSRIKVLDMPPHLIPAAFAEAMEITQKRGYPSYQEEQRDYNKLIARAAVRTAEIRKGLGLGQPETAPAK